MTRLLIAVLGIGLCLAGYQSAQAQQYEGQLQALWQEVLFSYPGLKVKSTHLESAKMDERAVFGARLPQFRAQAQNSYATYNGISGAFFPQPGLFNINGATGLDGPSWTFNTYGSVTLEWELFAFGKHHFKAKAARSHTQNVAFKEKIYEIQLQKELSQRYLRLLYNQTQLITSQANTDRLHTVYTITSGLASAGLKSAADSLMATSAFNQALADHEKHKGAYRASEFLLQELVGNKGIDVKASLGQFLRPLEPSFNKTAKTNGNHPVLAAIEAQQSTLDYQGKSEIKSALPTINLIGGYAYRGTGIHTEGTVSGSWNDGFSNGADNGLVGMGITWNISDLYTRKQRSESLNKQAESLGHQHEQYKHQMQTALESAQAQLLQQFTEVEKTDQAQRQANAAYMMYLSRYKSGLMDLSQLLQIQILLEQAEKKHIEAAFAYWMLMAEEAGLTADFAHLFTIF